MKTEENDRCIECSAEVIDGGSWGYCIPCSNRVFDELKENDMEFRIEELRQMLIWIEDALQERLGVLLLHEDRARLRSNHNKIKLYIAQLEQANQGVRHGNK